MRTIALLVVVIALIGCKSSSEFGDNGAPASQPKPLTDAQLKEMPPQAQQHAQGMSSYAKAQEEAMRNRAGSR